MTGYLIIKLSPGECEERELRGSFLFNISLSSKYQSAASEDPWKQRVCWPGLLCNCVSLCCTCFNNTCTHRCLILNRPPFTSSSSPLVLLASLKAFVCLLLFKIYRSFVIYSRLHFHIPEHIRPNILGKILNSQFLKMKIILDFICILCCHVFLNFSYKILQTKHKL